MSSIASQPLSTPLQMEPPVSNQDSSLNNMGPQKPLLPSKRKAASESFSNNPLSSIPNKRGVLHMDVISSPSPNSNSNSNSPLSVNRKQTQVPNSQPNKRMMRNESMSSNKTVSPRVQMSTSKTAPMEVSPKVQSESYVRAKMRETLSAALSVGIQTKDEEPSKNSSHEESGNAGPTADVAKPQYNYVMPETDDTFFVKDELLQGNGLSWAWDMEVVDEKSNPSQQSQTNETGTDNVNDTEEVVKESPQELAIKIEAELFKLFGGVNKKYKEKGRSLMFNLKDRSNPELREKVLSSKISPERLCSMTPEELASKELSEWRMAKAEELDKMIVLPDSDVDMRRLVKKTHKGEYQVIDFEQDDGISVEVAVGSSSSSLSQFRPKKKKVTTTDTNQEVNGQEVHGQEVNGQEVKVKGEETDYMQELIVEEFKDEGFLPPIVSLDEFMESLDTEPPFENLAVDDKEVSKASVGPTCAEVEVHAEVAGVKSVERKALVGPSVAVGESLWEGDLQLTVGGSMVSVIGLFRSGEKTSTKEWPGSIEIKGRVRLEAFEKFLQELPMSRTRAVMVVHFALKDKSPEFQRSSLSESVDSYIAEERVGFGEPTPGTEVYFCPPNKRNTEMLSRLLSKDQTEIQKSTDNGLTGVVVWRRPQPPAAMLPPPKHHRKNISSRRQETINTNTISKPPPPPLDTGGDDDDEDDIPPGFGPGVVAARDEDDLPEFSFSGGSGQVGQLSRIVQSSTTRKPVAPHMRQLVHEYGNTNNNNSNSNNNNIININNNNININNSISSSNINKPHWNANRPWNREEDDDIPEWQPQQPPQPQVQLTNHMVNQGGPMMMMPPVMHIGPPPNLMQNVWVQPHGPHGVPPPNGGVPGRHYGGMWRPEESRGRGF